jgi:hypothetical protein
MSHGARGRAVLARSRRLIAESRHLLRELGESASVVAGSALRITERQRTAHVGRQTSNADRARTTWPPRRPRPGRGVTVGAAFGQD